MIDLVSSANASLVRITAEYENLTQELEQALRDKQDLMGLLERKNDELNRLAATDPLTGLANRRRFTEVINETLAAAEAQGQPMSMVMIDLDHFKNVNDTYGHQCGDDVLVEASRRIALGFRSDDFTGRLGGEEFAVILANTDAERAGIAAERCRALIAASPIRCKDGSVVEITGSFGGATWLPGHGVGSSDELIARADTEMYNSKETGRNRVTWERQLAAAK